ncbi:hypothetical protein [Dehalococcoides mccartyi]|uniref:Uncharacterized protein n=1 Tax=Dehalococcoides mccartyi TaxID=61435 RepID=A0A328EKU7_9CHLR|nr:hypothetical protein [Dehalococcoides mccartyi]AOV99844.1 hypothetical protein DCWBC2_1222 [Dehalococcoides mccartyi]RAL69242.1 hypothetical protein C1G87_1258 [Dehalococcoides mccartyi]
MSKPQSSSMEDDETGTALVIYCLTIERSIISARDVSTLATSLALY